MAVEACRMGVAGSYDGTWLFAGTYIRGELGEYQGLIAVSGLVLLAAAAQLYV